VARLPPIVRLSSAAVLATVLAAAPAGSEFWIQPVPVAPPEEALRAAVLAADPAARLDALRGVATSVAGSATSGLAWLAIGLQQLEAGRFAEAEAALGQPDVALTAVADRALLSLAAARAGERHLQQAAETYETVLQRFPQTPLVCDVLSSTADAWTQAGQRERALPFLQRLLNECPGWEPTALLRLGQYEEARGRQEEAADYYDRLDCDYPSSPRSLEGAKRLAALRGRVPPVPPAERYHRDLRKASFLSDEGRHREAIPLLRALMARTPPSVADGEIVRMRLARALIALDKQVEALRLLQPVADASVFGAEAAFLRARAQAERSKRPDAYQNVVNTFPGSQWAEEALLALANFYMKDQRLAEAAPYFNAMLKAFPDGRYLERASWWVGWWEYTSGRYAGAAAVWENVAQKRKDSVSSAAALYWAARARQQLGQPDKAQALFTDTVKRFKHTYHGQRASEALGLVQAGASSTHPALSPRGDGRTDVPEPFRTRVRQLLMVERLDDARGELERVARSAQAQATVAWIYWRQGRTRPAIAAMRRAYPDWRSESGDRLPFAVWRILYPLDYEAALVARAGEEGLDPSLVAALIWQESAFDHEAQSIVGARGLMQLMPSTGRLLARRLGERRPTPQDLHDPSRNLKLGALYLKDMIDRFGGRVERALAAYNAGPTRVVRWTSGRPDMPAEEFIESIPFSETRTYVMNILAHREQYRRLYSMPEKPEPSLLATLAEAAPAPTTVQAPAAPARKPVPTASKKTTKKRASRSARRRRH